MILKRGLEIGSANKIKAGINGLFGTNGKMLLLVSYKITSLTRSVYSL